jgi:hypothetical protein
MRIKEDIASILSGEKSSNGQRMVLLEEMADLLGDGAEFVSFNKKVGTCYCHVVSYKEREFFCATGTERVYDKSNGEFLTRKEFDARDDEGCYVYVL